MAIPTVTPNAGKGAIPRLFSYAVMIFALSSFSLLFYTSFIAGGDYPVNYVASGKIFLYLSLVFCLIVYIFLGGLSYDRSGWVFPSVFYTLAVVFIYFFGSKVTGSRVDLFLLLNLCYFSYIARDALRFWIECALRWRLSVAVFIATSVVLVLVPLVMPKYLNYESSLALESKLRVVDGFADRSLTLTVPKGATERVKRNISYLEGASVYQKLPILLDHGSDGELKITGAIGPDLTWLCTLVSGDIGGDEARGVSSLVKQCQAGFQRGSGLSMFNLLSELKNYEFVDDDLFRQIKKNIIAANGGADHSATFERAPIEIMLVRGYLFHHYNSILEGISEGADRYFYNQYGFGPLAIVRIIQSCLSISSFDALFLSIPLINAVVLCLVLFFYRKNGYIILSFALSIFVVFGVSNYFAPFLYYTRYLPLVVLFIVTSESKEGGGGWFEASIQNRCLALFFFFLIGIYSKEYAVLTLVPLTIVSFMHRWRMGWLGVGALVAGFMAVYLCSHSSAIQGANFKALISGVGFGAGLDFSLMLFLCFFGYCSFVLFRLVGVENLDSATVFRYLWLGFLSVKFVVNSSPNHFGPMILLFAIFVNDLVLRFPALRNSFLVHDSVLFFLAMSILAVPGVRYLSYTSSFSETEYSAPEFSSIFKADSELLNKGRALKDFDGYRYGIVSRQDDFLRIYTGRFLTGSFPNLSTNLNFPADLKAATAVYGRLDYVLVDNELLSDTAEGYILKNLYNQSPRLNDFVRDYMTCRRVLIDFVKENTLARQVIKSNRYFTLFGKTDSELILQNGGVE